MGNRLIFLGTLVLLRRGTEKAMLAGDGFLSSPVWACRLVFQANWKIKAEA